MLETFRDGYRVDSDLEPIEFESVFTEISDEDYRDSEALMRLKDTFDEGFLDT